MAEKEKPNILILGGVGFIGRNLVQWLVEKRCVKHIRVVDKVLPSVAFLGKEHKDAFSNPIVKFKQGNAQSPASLAKVFHMKNGEQFDYVVNLAAETKYGQEPVVYEERIVGITKAVIDECKKHTHLKGIIEVSTAQVYEDSKKASNESAKLKPWTTHAEYKLKSEELWIQSGLPVVILRPAIVYGPGDVQGIMPRITIGRVYKFMDEKMKMLWGGELKINTVHVQDVAAAIWAALSGIKALPAEANKRIFNLADKTETDQRKVSAILQKIFGIRTGFYNAVINKLAKMNMKGATEEVNDKHLPPWSALCNKFKIEASPISPYIAPQLLYDHNLSVDGSAIEAAPIGFNYTHTQLTEELIRNELEYWIAQHVFPPNVSDDEPDEQHSGSSSTHQRNSTDKDEDEE